MPLRIDPDGGSSAAWLLTGLDGRPLARFHRGYREGRPLADLFEPVNGVGTDELVSRLLVDLPGWAVAGPPALGARLRDLGGRPRRHAHCHVRDLAADPPPAEWATATHPDVELVPLRPKGDHAPARLASIWRAAFPAGHPDHLGEPPPDALRELTAELAGQELGPLLPCSGVAIDRDTRRLVGACVVTDIPGVRPFAGPWVVDLFRDPRHPGRGIGAALLRRSLALAAEQGHATLGLAVTDGNPAQALYDACGMRRVLESWVVVVPT